MTRTLRSVAIACATAALALAAVPLRAQLDSKAVSDLSVWHPAPGALDAVRKQCGAGNGADIESCFLAAMKQQGAPNTAIAFAQSMANSGQIYLKAFRHTGRVSIGYFEYVFRANETEGVAILNGTPSPIDVDDPQYLTKAMLAPNVVYQQLAGKYPNISTWPGDRTSPAQPEVRERNSGGTQVLVRYIFKDGCHACANVGSARVSFNFDATGKFEAVRLMNVIPGAPPSTDQPTEQDPAGPASMNETQRDPHAAGDARFVNASFSESSPQLEHVSIEPASPVTVGRGLRLGSFRGASPAFPDSSQNSTPTETLPPQEIHANAGQNFTITLEGNRSTGYSWQLKSPLDSALLKKAGVSYRSKNPGTPGAGEDNLFTFHAKKKGTTDVTFVYLRPWEKDVPPAKTAAYHITID
jgi:inhibitor of cysteine peptidase